MQQPHHRLLWMFAFNAEKEVLQLISREVEQEETVKQTLSPKYQKEDLIVCGEAEDMQMQPLLQATSMKEETLKKPLAKGNNRRKELDELRDRQGHGDDQSDGKTRYSLSKDAVEEHNRTHHSVSTDDYEGEGLSTCSHEAKGNTGPCRERNENKVEVNTLISPIQDVKDDYVSTERERNKKDVNGGSANNERIVTSFCDPDQAAKADEKEEREPQKQPKDLNNVSVQEKTIKGIGRESCHKCNKVSVEIVHKLNLNQSNLSGICSW